LYPSGLLNVTVKRYTRTIKPMNFRVITEVRYTKHYYAGSQRVMSKVGSDKNIGKFDCSWLIIPFSEGGVAAEKPEETLVKADKSEAKLLKAYNITPAPDYGQNAGYAQNCVSSHGIDFAVEKAQSYWYHSDHLGSASYITGADGQVCSNINYFPTGEVFVEQNLKTNVLPYKFNGKELDAETGYYYYGARYYNPKVSLWLNVDPLAEQTGQPYIAFNNNPVRFIDPTGMAPIDPGSNPDEQRGFFGRVWDWLTGTHRGYKSSTPLIKSTGRLDVGIPTQVSTIGCHEMGGPNPLEAFGTSDAGPAIRIAVKAAKGTVDVLYTAYTIATFNPDPNMNLNTSSATSTLGKVAEMAGSVSPLLAVEGKVAITTGKVAAKGGVKLPSKIHTGSQGKHIVGHNNYNPNLGKSILDANSQTLLDGVNLGKYSILRKNQNNVIVDFGENIGTFFKNGKAVGPTQYGTIHYGNKGAHIVPANPIQY
jgi:RHS repeat-associated protein